MVKIENNDAYCYKSGDGIWFTSDTHFGHDNIMRFCERPFSSSDEMNETLIKNWNDRVGKDDTVFHMGDFAFGSQKEWHEILGRLNGHICLLRGNHDEKNLKRNAMYNKLEWVDYQMHIRIENQWMYLNHFPFLCYAGTYRTGDSMVWELFGHVHSRPDGEGAGLDASRLECLFPVQYDVGVDNNGFAPVSFHEVRDIIARQRDEAAAMEERLKESIARLRNIYAGRKVLRLDGTQFKSGKMENTVKDVMMHNYRRGAVAFTFEEDDSMVEPIFCINAC